MTKTRATALGLRGLLLVEPTVFPDDRGFFLESYNRGGFEAVGITCEFVQDNHSRSNRGILRGMHYQTQPGQAKLVRVSEGKIFDVAVDIRPESDTFGKWEGVELDSESHRQLFVPVGFAHGFCVLSEYADVLYKLSAPYDPTTEAGFRWDDAEIGIDWPVTEPVLSARDRSSESFATLRERLGVGS